MERVTSLHKGRHTFSGPSRRPTILRKCETCEPKPPIEPSLAFAITYGRFDKRENEKKENKEGRKHDLLSISFYLVIETKI